MPLSAPFPYAGEAAAFASSLLWAGSGIVFRRMKGRVPPAGMNLAKNSTATVCFSVVLLLVTGAPWPVGLTGEAWLWLAVSGVVGLAVCDTFLLRAMMEIGPQRATLFMALAPVLVFLGALLPPFSQTEALSRATTWIGTALALAGIVLAASEAPVVGHDPRAYRAGVRDALIASTLQAAGVLLARLGIEHGAGPLDASSIRLAAGVAGLLAGGLWFRRLRPWGRALATPGTLPVLVTAAFFGTFLGIGMNQAGLTWATSTGAVSTINALAPVWLIPLTTVFLGERHGARAWLSTILALGGVALLAM